MTNQSQGLMQTRVSAAQCSENDEVVKYPGSLSHWCVCRMDLVSLAKWYTPRTGTRVLMTGSDTNVNAHR